VTRRRVVLYGRADCHLCDEARRTLAELRAAGARFELEEVDIDSEEVLLSRFLERIPVIAVDGEIVSELVPDRAALEASLDTVGA
jgi:glutaredoxin